MHYVADIGPEVTSSQNIFNKLSQDSGTYNPDVRYPNSKLLNVFFTRALASRLGASSPLVVNCVNPGYCKSELARNVNNDSQGLLAYTTEEGSRQLVWAAVGGEDQRDELKGAYISSSQINEPSDVVLGEEGKVLEGRVWDDTMKILFKLSPKVAEIVGRI